jgi:NAD(P)-dependent dehydrogenase (short-subunit alcohol dehydrogenase family)
MINNAGVAAESSDPQPIYEATEDRFDLTMKVNARGVFLGCKHAAIQMMKQDRLPGRDRGWIVNMSSGLAVRGMAGVPCYSASKGAVWSMTRAVAMDLAPFHIHCNAILPGCESVDPKQYSGR